MHGDIVLSLPLFGRSHFLTFNLFNFDFLILFNSLFILFLFFSLGTPNNDASKLEITLWMPMLTVMSPETRHTCIEAMLF